MKKRLDDHRELLLEDGTTGSEQKWNSVERSSKQFVHFDHWPHVFNLANSIIGVSILAMPYCLQQVIQVSFHLFYFIFTERNSGILLSSGFDVCLSNGLKLFENSFALSVQSVALAKPQSADR